MKPFYSTKCAYFLFSVFFFFGCKDDLVEQIKPDTPDLNERLAAVENYKNQYLASNISNPQWTGNSQNCLPGTVSQASHDAVIKRINYFRHLVGLNDDCVLIPSMFSQLQEAALMMTANNQLSHNPPASWKCYTSAGKSGAGTSNIALGAGSASAITLFMFDNGSNNADVGHRRWILHSTKQKFSYGSTANAMALYVFSQDNNTKIPEFIAYPAKGYMPHPLVPERWSFSIPAADFSNASVTVAGISGNVPVSIVSANVNGYGDNTIVYQPTISLTDTADVSYAVKITGIKGAPQSSYSYTTTIFRP
ncbi:hypothetical protein L0657_16740 [Dyadobacter sp. CY345]|uniref:hypothetical protein n=1 Tax=Dyadobacter sp. CY345 TaxID=2909335 RepID=UPI001F3E87D6|nr:hypothetical protein [Dyadobacter sp. CY345]MCF2445614.1 hypothetical protein [Dyadobacter sp. CY345]